jgi:hypothetical protein
MFVTSISSAHDDQILPTDPLQIAGQRVVGSGGYYWRTIASLFRIGPKANAPERSRRTGARLSPERGMADQALLARGRSNRT